MTLKLKRTPALYLVGFMCSGKTSVGRELAEELGWCFIDLDAEIEAGEGEPVREIFRRRGEAAFREIETNTLRKHVNRIEAGQPCVLALGGGTFVQPQNWEIIENNGVTVWLDCTLDTVLARLGDDATRPLAEDRNGLAQLYGDRRPLYSRADFRVEVDTDQVSAIVQRILKLPIF
ncbi:MAG TPA: shikimate kinase [Bryobacteraceae bacterium]|jgi:shikimate kinase|nr:shikimate kinase [Bryobacteraceae bacterium]